MKAKDYRIHLNDILQELSVSHAIDRAPLSRSFFTPELASLSQQIPHGDDWVFENKFDGYRILARKLRGKVTLYSRNGLDWTERFPEVAEALKSIELHSFVLDGEIIAKKKNGKPNFSSLHKRLNAKSGNGFIYQIFDLIYVDGYDLRNLALIARKKMLEHCLGDAKYPLRLSHYTVGRGDELYRLALITGQEGILAKRASSHYLPRRSEDWLKIQCKKEEEFVIGGFTDPQGSHEGIGSLLVGYYDDDGSFVYTGRVGTGFDHSRLLELRHTLDEIETPKSPFRNPLSALEKSGVHYVRPQFVAQVTFTELTDDQRLRHPVFMGLREDKNPAEVTHQA